MNEADDAESNKSQTCFVDLSGVLITTLHVMSKTFQLLLPVLVMWECMVAVSDASAGEQ